VNDETYGPLAGEGVDPATVVAEAMAAYERGDLDAVATFVHPDAEIEMVPLDDDVIGPEGLRETLERLDGGIHKPTMTRIERVGDDAALMVGRIQYADPTLGGVADRPAVWLSVLRDGLIWRTRVFRTAEDAHAAYAEMTPAAEAPPARGPHAAGG
jgi:hypothetical protein